MSKESSQEAERLSQETAFHLLGHSHRLALLECLEHYDEPITLADAAEWVASALEEEAVENVDAERVKQVYLSLYHSHIPKLDDHEVIEYHQEEDMVALDAANQLVRYRRMCSTAPNRD